MRKTKLLLTALLMHALLALTYTHANAEQINNTKDRIFISNILLTDGYQGIVASQGFM